METIVEQSGIPHTHHFKNVGLLACSLPPEDRAGWTLQLLADQLVECEIVDSISTETVRQTLKKTNSSPG